MPTKLEFETTNNVEEYEALVLGLRVAKDIKIEELAVFGDVELIVHQVKNMYQEKHPRLRTYKNEVWDLIDNFFLSFNISFVPREENSMADSLVVFASNFKIHLPHKLKYDVEVKYRPYIPNNVKHWKVFEDDLEIKIFLETVEEFSALHIDQDHDDTKIPHADIFLNTIVDHKIFQLPSNHIPKGLVPLEILFDINDVVVKVKGSSEEVDVTECNLGTEENPKYVKLSRSLSNEKRDAYVKLLKEFVDVFSWKYEYLQTYDTSIIEHKIPLKEETKSFRQKLGQINPMLLPIMEKEVKNLLDANIIIPLRYFDWVANLVSVRKNNGERRLFVDFINLNRSSKKDSYPLPKMEHILQRETGSTRMFMIDGISCYNQIFVLPEEREKTTFTTPWGTFMYAKITFGLMNVGETFQQEMDISFIGEKENFVVIYLDDITVFSRYNKEHYHHLKKVFLKCRNFGLSLNPKKSLFSMKEGNLLGHIVSAEGLRIDPSRVEAIQTLSLARSKKKIQYFLGKIMFLRRFISNFVELVKYITSMLRNGNEVKWIVEARNYFDQIKQALTKAHVLISPDYSKEFPIFSFASHDTLVVVLLQTNTDGMEQPISFFSRELRDAYMRYDIMDK
jgi:hypothetical protein